MAFALETLRLLLQLHRARAFEGPVLNLGRQTVHAPYADLLAVIIEQGVTPVELPADIRASIVAGQSQDGDRLFFAHLGLELAVLDISDYERAEFVHDLNQPIPNELRERFKTVIDGGTSEHVFDVRAAMRNIADLLAPGGLAIHISPANNYCNHGYWQLSPRSFYDYYAVNGFEDLEVTMIVSPRDPADTARPWAAFAYDPRGPQSGVNFFSSANDRLTCLFRARKTAASTSDRIPEQSFVGSSNGATPMVGASVCLELTSGGLIFTEY